MLAGAVAEDEYVGGHYGAVCDFQGCGWVLCGEGVICFIINNHSKYAKKRRSGNNGLFVRSTVLFRIIRAALR